MLENRGVAARLPARDLERARRSYADKLGLEPSEERPGGPRYRYARGEFALFQSEDAPSGSNTQMAWEVDDIEATVAELKGFESIRPPKAFRGGRSRLVFRRGGRSGSPRMAPLHDPMDNEIQFWAS